MSKIEDYAMISDCRTAALIDREGSINWLCLPSFDSFACFASLLGDKENGRWIIRPKEEYTCLTRAYTPDTFNLNTCFESKSGKIKITDFMPLHSDHSHIIRIVKGLKGKVEMEMELTPRFEYGALIPLFIKRKEGVFITKGPDQLLVKSSLPQMEIRDEKVVAYFTLEEGDEVSFQLEYSSSHEPVREPLDVKDCLNKTAVFWKDWLEACHIDDISPHPEIIRRAVLVLKAMTSKNSGSIVAAVTTSLPSEIGESRNWDYRYCWPRDAALAMRAVLNSTGQREEILAWRHWIIRATAGRPSQMEVLYTLQGTRVHYEYEVKWLKGFENSRPVRIGNKASEQVQLDIYEAVIEVFYKSEKMGFPPLPEGWDLARRILKYLEKIWVEPDEGIWEVRGPARHFVHSKAMVWSAFNLCIKAHMELGIEGPVEHWREVRDKIHKDICEKGFNKKVNSFTQYYGSDEVDASLLRLPIIEFLPLEDERIQGTIKKIEEDLMLEEGLLMRYRPNEEVEGLPPSGNRAFLICSAWLGEVYALQGNKEKTQKVFDKVVSLANDVGLLSEQFNPETRTQLGNFPQAYSHIALIRLEIALSSFSKSDNPP